MDLVIGLCVIVFEWKGLRLEFFRNYTSLYTHTYTHTRARVCANTHQQPTFSKRFAFLKRLMPTHLHLSPLGSASALDKWAYMIGLKKEVAEANKI